MVPEVFKVYQNRRKTLQKTILIGSKLYTHLLMFFLSIPFNKLPWIFQVFESNVLPSYATGHVQFIMFYLCSVSSKIQEKFMDYLWKRFTSPNTPSILRQTAIAYIASLIARYGNTDCGVSGEGYKKKIGFRLKINCSQIELPTFDS